MKPVAVKVMVSSSPGRGEKLPDPGLGRLFRRKSGRRSARARSSPMIVSRSRSVARRSATEPALPEAGDPTSPKVTCIGQVRIHKKKKKKGHNNDIMPTPLPNVNPAPKLCRCFDRGPACTLFCHPSSLWRCWGRNEKEEEANDPAALAAPVIAFVREIRSVEEEEEEENEDGNGDSEEEEEEETTGFVSAAAPVDAPPKSALLLMRCRSAPHNRSSALALSRFATPTENGGNGDEVKDPAAAAAAYLLSASNRKSTDRKSTGDVYISSSSSASASAAVVGQVTTLTRCKSAPAEKAEKMIPVGPEVLSYCGKNGSGGSGKERLGMVQEEGPHL